MELVDLIDTKRIPVFACIGTMRMLEDSIGPRVGSLLKSAGYYVVGDMDNTLNAKTIPDMVQKYLTLNKDIYQIIAIDCCLFNCVTEKPYQVINSSTNPGAAIGKSLPSIGEISIHCDINHEIEISRELKRQKFLLSSINQQIIKTDWSELEKEVNKVVLKTFIYIDNQMYEAFGKKNLEVVKCAAHYINGNDETVRTIADKINVSKTSVNYNISKYLERINSFAYGLCKQISLLNYKYKYIKGGKATKKRWLKEKEKRINKWINN